VSNILHQITKVDKKDPEISKLVTKIERLRNEIGSKLKQTETDESALKFSVIQLAENIEKIMVKTGNKNMVNQIFGMLELYFKESYDLSEKTCLMFESFFDDYPQYTRKIVKNNSPYILMDLDATNSFDIETVIKSEGRLPEENKLYRTRVDNALHLLDKLDFSRLTKDQCLLFNEKMRNVIKNKQHELEHNYRLVDKKGEKRSHTSKKYSPYDDEPQHEIASPGNKVTQQLIKIRNQWNDIITQTQYMKFHSPELENEIASCLSIFYKTLRFITDHKHKASVADWVNMSLATNDFNPNYASSNIKFKAPLCAKCRDRDETLDPVGKKKIFRHIQMYSEYQIDRKWNEKGEPTVPPYIWRCKRCGGTQQKEEEMSVERINESIVYTNAYLIDLFNKSDIYRAFSIMFEELIKPNRLVTAHNTSNKLLSKK
jgi:hypothetical protein